LIATPEEYARLEELRQNFDDADTQYNFAAIQIQGQLAEAA